MLECELKFRIEDLQGLASRLEGMGVVLSVPAHEENRIMDLPDGSLSNRHVLLRVRSTEDRTILTVKAPAPSPGMKIRRELEAEVSCPPSQLIEMLSVLGFSVSREYSKTRRKGVLGEAVLCLDSLWFGEFLEIEARTPEAVEEAVASLGLDRSAGLSETYIELERKALEDRDA
ncbi:class IV adenylate cyclase [Candidatus Fermentibacteria bacterium]|nr:class IV adenylate cyclase [Candidatus Fermentibacteria bacterium]